MEKFDPTNPKYKKVEDLPKKQQDKFVDVPEGGFVKREANEYLLKKIQESGIEGSYNSLENEASYLKSYVENKDYCINEAPKLIRNNEGGRGIALVAEKLGVAGDFLSYVLYVINRFDADAEPLLDAVADSYFIQDKKRNFRSWSHDLCHSIENYGEDGLSLLDTPESRKVLTKLIDESVERLKENADVDIGCIDRIVGPLLKFNLTQMDAKDLEKSYIYKPESIKDSEFIGYMREGVVGFDLNAFLNTNSPLEFYRRLFEKGEKLPGFLNPAQQIELLQALKKHLPGDLINKYVEREYNPNGKSTTYDELVKNVQESKESTEVIKGIYVDVEGTLIERGVLNKDLVKKLEKLATEGNKIIIFTGGDIAAIGAELKKLGLPEHFLPVHAKNEYRGKVLEVLVDDTPPEYQGFKTLELHKPGYYWA